MNKQEAEAFFEENYRQYAESGYFKIALRGSLSLLKEIQKWEKPRAEKDGKTGILVRHAMEYATQIVDWIDYAAEHPEMDIAITGVATQMSSGYPKPFAWYSPAGSPELWGTHSEEPIGGDIGGKCFFATNEDSHMPTFNRTAKFIHTLPSWENDDHDGGYMAVWQNAHGETGSYDLMDRPRLDGYNLEPDFEDEEEAEEYAAYMKEHPIPPQIAALADTISLLDELEDTPEGEQVILHIWKTLFPETDIHIQRENGKCRYFDNKGGEYFLLCGDGTNTKDNGAFFDRYMDLWDLEAYDKAWYWGFPPSADWIPPEMFEYDDLEEGEEGVDW